MLQLRGMKNRVRKISEHQWKEKSQQMHTARVPPVQNRPQMLLNISCLSGNYRILEVMELKSEMAAVSSVKKLL